MRVGTFCYATSRGLGHLARDFYLNGVVTDVLVVEHGSIPTNKDWYPGVPTTPSKPLNKELMRDFVKGKDAMLFFETPFDWDIFEYCKQNGVRTYLITMYECTPISHHRPSKYICPSDLDMKYFAGAYRVNLPVSVPWKQRTVANHYVHNGGYLGLRGREGTNTLIEAMQHVKSDLKLTIRCQENVDDAHLKMVTKDPRVEYIAATVPFNELHSTGDVYVAPQKFNGCSLPLQEAFASGFAVMTTDRFPMNTWTPKDLAIPVSKTVRSVSIGGPYMKFDESIVDPKVLAITMDHWHGRDISEYSLMGKAWAEENSWEKLKPEYMKILECDR